MKGSQRRFFVGGPINGSLDWGEIHPTITFLDRRLVHHDYRQSGVIGSELAIFIFIFTHPSMDGLTSAERDEKIEQAWNAAPPYGAKFPGAGPDSSVFAVPPW